MIGMRVVIAEDFQLSLSGLFLDSEQEPWIDDIAFLASVSSAVPGRNRLSDLGS
jgi:hypothetical protein